MMDFIMVPTIMAIITLGIYKLFELFVCKKERLMLIEKMGDKYVPDVACMPKLYGNFSFSALKLGCLLVGMDNWRVYRETVSLVYGACVLSFGGIGLITAFIAELKLSKK